MKRPIAWIVLSLGLSPCLATAKTVCIQLDDNGDVIVLRGVGNGSKAVSAYLAEFQGGASLFAFKPLSGSAIVASTTGILIAGLTEYGISVTETGDGFIERTVFHRVICRPGSDGKIGVLDDCQDTTWILPLGSQDGRPAHVIDCIPEIKVP